MTTAINALPILLDRKATFYLPELNACEDDCNIILATDGTNVEYITGHFYDFDCPPFNALQIELNMTDDEFMELTRGEDTYVDLVLLRGGKIGVYITTQHDVIYDEQHELVK